MLYCINKKILPYLSGQARHPSPVCSPPLDINTSSAALGVQFNIHLGFRLGFRDNFRDNFSTRELQVSNMTRDRSGDVTKLSIELHPCTPLIVCQWGNPILKSKHSLTSTQLSLPTTNVNAGGGKVPSSVFSVEKFLAGNHLL